MNKEALAKLPRPIVPLDILCMFCSTPPTFTAPPPRTTTHNIRPERRVLRVGRFGRPIEWAPPHTPASARNTSAPAFVPMQLENMNNRHAKRSLAFLPQPNYADACVAVHCCL